MVIYNITAKPLHTIAGEWLYWQRHTHIPEIMATGFFTDSKIYRLLDVDETDGPTFCTQLYAASLEDLQQYIAEFSDFFQQKAFAKWGDQFIAFRTIMEFVQ